MLFSPVATAFRVGFLKMVLKHKDTVRISFAANISLPLLCIFWGGGTPFN